MTIPIVPGPFAGLGAGLTQGISAYNAEKQKQYEEALKGSQFIYNLIQTGQLTPETLNQPNVQQGLARAKLPQPEAGNIVPSVQAIRAQTTAQRVAGSAPGSAQRTVPLGLPGESDIGQEKIASEIAQFQGSEMEKYPAIKNIMAKIPPGDIAGMLLEGQRAAVSAPVYREGAERFVSQAWTELMKGDIMGVPGKVEDYNTLADKAYEIAKSDPEYSSLIQSGQMSPEYFKTAAREAFYMDDKARQAWFDAQVRLAGHRNDERMIFTGVLQGYDRDIAAQKDLVLKMQSDLADSMVWLPDAQKKMQAGQEDQLTPTERQALQKSEAFNQALQDYYGLLSDRRQVQSRFTGKLGPPAPSPGGYSAPGSGGVTIRGGGAALPGSRVPGVKSKTAPAAPGPAATPAAAPTVNIPRKPKEEDSVYWERLKAAGYTPQQATAKVEATKAKVKKP